jgi:hypothetical protein
MIMTTEGAAMRDKLHAALLELLDTHDITPEGALKLFTLLNKEF